MTKQWHYFDLGNYSIVALSGRSGVPDLGPRSRAGQAFGVDPAHWDADPDEDNEGFEYYEDGEGVQDYDDDEDEDIDDAR